METEQVRVLEHTDSPGALATPHDHPDSVMVALSSFTRRLYAHDWFRNVQIAAGGTYWLPAHHGRTPATPTRR